MADIKFLRDRDYLVRHQSNYEEFKKIYIKYGYEFTDKEWDDLQTQMNTLSKYEEEKESYDDSYDDEDYSY